MYVLHIILIVCISEATLCGYRGLGAQAHFSRSQVVCIFQKQLIPTSSLSFIIYLSLAQLYSLCPEYGRSGVRLHQRGKKRNLACRSSLWGKYGFSGETINQCFTLGMLRKQMVISKQLICISFSTLTPYTVVKMS